MTENEKKLVSEKVTFEVDVLDKYGTLERMVESKDYLMIVSTMSEEVRREFFYAYPNCEKFEIVSHDCVGNKCFIAIEFWYVDHSAEEEQVSKIVDEEGNEVPHTVCPRCGTLNVFQVRPAENKEHRAVHGIAYEVHETVCRECSLYFKDAFVEAEKEE